jgi:hypothetical protein
MYEAISGHTVHTLSVDISAKSTRREDSTIGGHLKLATLMITLPGGLRFETGYMRRNIEGGGMKSSSHEDESNLILK